jgi:hypothetical protein
MIYARLKYAGSSGREAAPWGSGAQSPMKSKEIARKPAPVVSIKKPGSFAATGV